MKYKIDSAKTGFPGDALKTYFQQLSNACQAHGTDFIVIGAFARDLILEQVFGDRGGTITEDIDIAVALTDWQQYDAVIALMEKDFGLHRSKRVAHEYFTSQGLKTDIVPFGEIEQNHRISFPSSPGKAMNMMGFNEVMAHSLIVRIDDEVDIKIPSVAGIILIKLMAWNDRQPDRYGLKHIRDIGLLIDGYFDANLDLIYDDPVHVEIDEEMNGEFLHQQMSAGIIGRQINTILKGNQIAREELSKILRKVLETKGEHDLINSLATVLRITYAESKRVVATLAKFMA